MCLPSGQHPRTGSGTTVRLKQRFCEVSHEHRAVTHETGAQDQPALIFCPLHPAAVMNGAGRAHCSLVLSVPAELVREGGKVSVVCQKWCLFGVEE